ncbi:LysR family transcriptional regulator [Nakamurella sp. YIM 132087]|uniref:LysR family transcriptional regulator n=2 Tax=Nakamurella alba TaxID=2665158 RepID=A0A7K1FLV1_9ACTN|nr:LysR family transcriptional regulator [Nakamurella alba]
MDTDVLRWFQQVAEGATVTEVSEAAHITQPGLSRALARLDNEVGTPLLRRTGRVLRMTQAGVLFKRHVDGLLNQLDDGLAAVSQLVDPETGTVVLASHPSLSTWMVPGLIGPFRRLHPDVVFDLRQVRDDVTGPEPTDSRVDLEITTVRPADRTVEWYPLMVEPLRLAVPTGHRLADRERISLAEAADEQFISLRRPSFLRQHSETLCQQAGFEPDVVFEAEDVPTMRGFVAAGLGIAIVPAQDEDARGKSTGALVDLAIADPGAARQIGLGWSTQTRLLPSAELFRAHVLHAAESRRLPQPGR